MDLDKQVTIDDYAELMNDEYGEMLYSLSQLYCYSPYIANKEFVKQLEAQVDYEIEQLKANYRIETKTVTSEVTQTFTEIINVNE